MDIRHHIAAMAIKDRVDEIMARSEKGRVVMIPLSELEIPSKYPVSALPIVTGELAKQGIKAELKEGLYHVGL